MSGLQVDFKYILKHLPGNAEQTERNNNGWSSKERCIAHLVVSVPNPQQPVRLCQIKSSEITITNFSVGDHLKSICYRLQQK